jgi:hypothetical protein
MEGELTSREQEWHCDFCGNEAGNKHGKMFFCGSCWDIFYGYNIKGELRWKKNGRLMTKRLM